MNDKPAHRVYHGKAPNPEHGDVTIAVVIGGDGPTQRHREQVSALYDLAPSEPFWWGYSGGSPSRTAEAILDDALPDAVSADMLATMPKELRRDLTVAFMDDFLAYFHDDREFWLPARAVVRWIEGFFRESRSS